MQNRTAEEIPNSNEMSVPERLFAALVRLHEGNITNYLWISYVRSVQLKYRTSCSVNHQCIMTCSAIKHLASSCLRTAKQAQPCCKNLLQQQGQVRNQQHKPQILYINSLHTDQPTKLVLQDFVRYNWTNKLPQHSF